MDSFCLRVSGRIVCVCVFVIKLTSNLKKKKKTCTVRREWRDTRVKPIYGRANQTEN